MCSDGLVQVPTSLPADRVKVGLVSRRRLVLLVVRRVRQPAVRVTVGGWAARLAVGVVHGKGGGAGSCRSENQFVMPPKNWAAVISASLRQHHAGNNRPGTATTHTPVVLLLPGIGSREGAYLGYGAGVRWVWGRVD